MLAIAQMHNIRWLTCKAAFSPVSMEPSDEVLAASQTLSLLLSFWRQESSCATSVTSLPREIIMHYHHLIAGNKSLCHWLRQANLNLIRHRANNAAQVRLCWRRGNTAASYGGTVNIALRRTGGGAINHPRSGRCWLYWKYRIFRKG